MHWTHIYLSFVQLYFVFLCKEFHFQNTDNLTLNFKRCISCVRIYINEIQKVTSGSKTVWMHEDSLSDITCMHNDQNRGSFNFVMSFYQINNAM